MGIKEFILFLVIILVIHNIFSQTMKYLTMRDCSEFLKSLNNEMEKDNE